MIEFEIKRLAPSKDTIAKAYFDVAIAGMLICQIRLWQSHDGKVRMTMPPVGSGTARGAKFTDMALKQRVGDAAVAALNAMRGTSYEFTTKYPEPRVKEPEPAEPDTAGLRRVIRSDFAEEMTRAGLD